MPKGARLLVADIGGTNARFAIAEADAAGRVALSHAVRARHAERDWLEAARECVAAAGDAIDGASFAVAAPITGPRVRLTNVDVEIDIAAAAAALGAPFLSLHNDFEALALGAAFAAPEHLECIIAGDRKPGAPIVVAGPGTGLGLAGVFFTESGAHVISGQGGHQAFAPRDAIEAQLLASLSRQTDYVSFETVLSGAGLQRVYRALAGGAAAPLSSEEITQRAEQDGLEARACGLVARVLATFAAGAYLSFGARGGVILAGGLAMALRAFLRRDDFRDRWLSAGPMSFFIAGAPVYLLSDDGAALRGAALLARR